MSGFQPPDCPWPLLKRDELENTPSRNFRGSPGPHTQNSLNQTASPAPAVRIQPASASPSQSVSSLPVDLSRTPPIPPGPLSSEGERRLRRHFVALIQQCGLLLDLPNLTICTAITFFHRFYSVCAFQAYNPSLVSQSCLFLSSKVEENPRRVRDLLNVAYRVQHPMENPLQVSPLYWELKDSILQYEQILLRVLDYHLIVRHPHHFILHICCELEISQELTQIAYYILNDSYKTHFLLQFSNPAIAVSAIYLAGELLQEPISYRGAAGVGGVGGAGGGISSGNLEWWEYFQCQRAELEEICLGILDLYAADENFIGGAGVGGLSGFSGLSNGGNPLFDLNVSSSSPARNYNGNSHSFIGGSGNSGFSQLTPKMVQNRPPGGGGGGGGGGNPNGNIKIPIATNPTSGIFNFSSSSSIPTVSSQLPSYSSSSSSIFDSSTVSPTSASKNLLSSFQGNPQTIEKTDHKDNMVHK